MSFARWREAVALAAETDEALWARVRHLDIETRIAPVLAAFCEDLGNAAFIDPSDPPRRIRLRRGPNSDAGGGAVRRFVWVTFEDGRSPPTDDPTRLVRELGLAHYPAGAYIYRIPLDRGNAHFFVPTCLDAGLYEAWEAPPAGHGQPWGMTRDLVSGAPQRPELLTETVGHAAERPRCDLVSPPGVTVSVGQIVPDYRVGR